MSAIITHVKPEQSLPIVVVAPQLPPITCGVGDYTFNLTSAWSNTSEFHYLVAHGAAQSKAQYPNFSINAFDCNKESFLTKLAELSPSHLLIQYSGYGFHPLGCPVWLADALTNWRRQKNGKLVIMFHELWSLSPWWSKHFIIKQVHRLSIRRLVSLADHIFTSTQDYVECLQHFSPQAPVSLLPVGSNILPLSTGRSCPQQPGTFVLFGMQGTRVRALRELKEDLTKLHCSKLLEKLTLVGGGSNDKSVIEEKKLLESTLPHTAYSHIGVVSSQEVSNILWQAEFGISCQSWRSFTKSGSFMAYAAHGLNILSPHATRQESHKPFCWLTHPRELATQSDILNTTLLERSRQLQSWYRQHADWSKIAQTFKQAFEV